MKLIMRALAISITFVSLLGCAPAKPARVRPNIGVLLFDGMVTYDKVDGNPVRIAINGAYPTSLILPQGEHRIEFIPDPTDNLYGTVMPRTLDIKGGTPYFISFHTVKTTYKNVTVKYTGYLEIKVGQPPCTYEIGQGWGGWLCHSYREIVPPSGKISESPGV